MDKRPSASSATALQTPPHDNDAEQMVLGAVLIENDSLNKIVEILSPDDFYKESHRRIFSVMLDMFKRGEAIDLITLTEAIRGKAGIESAGDASYLSYLVSLVPTAANVQSHARLVKLSALERRFRRVGQEIIEHPNLLNGGPAKLQEELDALQAQLVRLDGKTQRSLVRAIGIREMLSKKFPPRIDLLAPWLLAQGLAMIYSARGIGKTHIALGIAVAVSSGGRFLRWEAPEPRGVLYIDGEMPATVIQERLSRIIASMEREPTAPLQIITPDLQPNGRMPDLSTTEGQLAIEPHLGGISLVILDNLSTLCRDGKENEGEGWLPVQSWALRLRAKGLSVLFIHHAGKGGGQRGTSRREDVLDTVINLKRPGDYRPEEGARFEIHFEKARGIYGTDVKSFETMLVTNSDDTQAWTLKDLEESNFDKVVDLLNQGLKQKEAAELLNLSEGQVSKYKKRVQDQGVYAPPKKDRENREE